MSLLVILALFRSVAGNVFAATPNLSIVTPVGTVRAGEPFAVLVRVTSGGEQINAIEAAIQYPTDLLTVNRVSQEQSVLTLWPEPPTVDANEGVIQFAGGRPGGFIAQDVTVLTISFTANAGGSPILFFDTTQTAVYAHDNSGTKLSVTALPATVVVADALVTALQLTSSTHATPDTWSRQSSINAAWQYEQGTDYSFLLSTDPYAAPDDVPDATAGFADYVNLADGVYYFTIKERPLSGSWSLPVQRRFLIDGTPPLPFTLERPDPAAVRGASLLVWSAQDATSGVTRAVLTVNGSSAGEVTSPLTLEPAWQNANLAITAYDAAGNATTAVTSSPPSRANAGWWYVAAAAALLGAAAVMFALRRR